MQHLIDVRNQLDRYTAPEKADWHLACINNRWTKRALASAGFGYPTPQETPLGEPERWKPVFSIADIGGKDSAAIAADYIEKERHKSVAKDVEAGTATGKDDITAATADASSSSGSDLGKTLSQSKAYRGSNKLAVVQGLNLPLFHVDLTIALQSAVANAQRRDQQRQAYKKDVEGEDYY